MLPGRPPSPLADLDPAQSKESPSHVPAVLGAPPLHAPPLEGSYANPLFSGPGGAPTGQVLPSRLPPPPPGRAGPVRPPFVPAAPSSRLPAPGFMAGGGPPLVPRIASWQPMSLAPANVSRTASGVSDAGALPSPTYQQHLTDQNAVPSSFNAPAVQQPAMSDPWDVPPPQPPPPQQQHPPAASDSFQGAPYADAWGNGDEAGDGLAAAPEYNAQQEALEIPPALWGQVPSQSAPGVGGFLASKKLPPPATSLESPLKARYAKGASGKLPLPPPHVRIRHFGAQHNLQAAMNAPVSHMGGGVYDGSSVASAPAPDVSDVEVNQFADEQPIPAENEFPASDLGNPFPPPPPPTMAPASFPSYGMPGFARTESGGSRSGSGGFDRACPPPMGVPGGLMKMGSGSMLPGQQPRGSFEGHGAAPAMFNPSMAGMPETPSSPAASRLAPPPQLSQPQSKAQKQNGESGETRRRKKRRGFCARLFIFMFTSLILGAFFSAGSTVVAITVAANLTHAAVAGVRRLPGSTSLSDAIGSWGPALDSAVAHVSGVSQSEWFRVLESFACDDLKPSCRATQWVAHKARVGASLGREAIHLAIAHAPHAWEGAVLPAANFTRSQTELLWSQMKGLRTDEGRAALATAVHHSIADARKLGEDSLGWGHCVSQHISTSGIQSLDQVAAACWTEWMGHYYMQNVEAVAPAKQEDSVAEAVAEKKDPSSSASISIDTENRHNEDGEEMLEAVMPSPAPAVVGSSTPTGESQPAVVVEDNVAGEAEKMEETQNEVSSPLPLPLPVEKEEEKEGPSSDVNEQPPRAPTNDTEVPTEVLEAPTKELAVEADGEMVLPVEEVLAPSPSVAPQPAAVEHELPIAAVEVEVEDDYVYIEPPSSELESEFFEDDYASIEPPRHAAGEETEANIVPKEDIKEEIVKEEAVVVAPEEPAQEPAQAPVTVPVAVEERGPSASEKLAEQAAALKSKLHEVTFSVRKSLEQHLITLQKAANNAADCTHTFIKANGTIVISAVAIVATTAAFLIGNATARRAAAVAAGPMTPRRPRGTRLEEDPATAYKSAQSGSVLAAIFGSGQKSSGEVVDQGGDAAPAAASKRRGRQSAPARLAPFDDDAGEEKAPAVGKGRRGGSGEAPPSSNRGRSRSRGPAVSTKTARPRKATTDAEEVQVARNTRKASSSSRKVG